MMTRSIDRGNRLPPEAVANEGPPVDAVPVMVVSSPEVSDRMSLHPRKDTRPEVALRRALFGRGLRYRVHLSVPGLPRRTVDVAFPGVKVAVFVDGCFWHGCPEHGMTPASNREWWRRKIDGNRRRDEQTSGHLVSLGWEVLRFWCHEEVSDMVDVVAASVGGRRASVAASTAATGRVGAGSSGMCGGEASPSRS